MNEINNEKMRFVASLVLLILAIMYMWLNNENQSIEYILLALAGFVVGGALMNNNKPKA